MDPQPGQPQVGPAPPRPPGRGVPAGLVAVIALVAAVVGGCSGLVLGSSADEKPTPRAAPKTVTVTATPPARTAPAAAPPTTKPPAPKPPAKKIKMPNVIGQNHQKAQNLLQSHGIFNLAEKDATGQNRLLLWDRNWTVVRQSPRPGTLINPTTVTVTLYSKKADE
ncbi:hypothetical protein GCM10027589_36230 [Actinocorallia lasiicapitis]